ncbi:SoxR reducing system RseC family protein [Uliginosibacterium sp. H1]|uniref:SoxR reducing system RseC family protein n=1 Tax=Uliginosibacterium sp. H1 TaxID=3114757 RepID=UPI002E1994EF|nr:SoxR reducing system RseC family protein [Uliginosibacterium sp. H1]
MQLEAVVSRVDGDQTYVRVVEAGDSALDQLFGDQGVEYAVLSDEAVQPGEKVLIHMPEGAPRGSLAKTWLLPILALLAGSVLGFWAADSDTGTLLGGMLGLGFAVTVWRVGQAERRRMAPRIIALR